MGEALKVARVQCLDLFSPLPTVKSLHGLG